MGNIKTIFISLLFILGIYFIVKSILKERELYENFEGSSENECPNVLIEENNKIYLYNTKKTKIPGVNPIVFNTLENYVEFLEFQRDKNIRCPVLKLRKTNNTQGDIMYKIKDVTPIDQIRTPDNVQVTAPVQKMIDATRDDPPYNNNSYPGFDKKNAYIGVNVPLDKM